MSLDDVSLIALGIFVIAVLYSSVGHGGASGYWAILSLFGVAAKVVKPTALSLNIIVSPLAAWQFWRAGYFRWELFWPFALLSMPLAFLGGRWELPVPVLKMLMGVVLLGSALRFLIRPAAESDTHPPSRSVAIAVGGVLGMLSGLTGTGGGIFLTPLIIVMRWAPPKHASAASALFILLNSAAGLLGNLSKGAPLPTFAISLGAAALIGGSIGSYYGSQRFSHTIIRKVLATVLTIAGFKLIFV